VDTETNNKERKPADFTEGSIIGSILKMGLPSMLGFLTNNFYHLVDTWWVSRLPGKEAAVAGITFFGVILMLMFSFNQLVGPGSVAVISRRYGEKQYAHAEKAIKETIILKLIFGFLFGFVGYFFARQLLTIVGAEGEALELGVSYGKVMFLAVGVPYATYSIFTALRGVANPKMAMVLMIAGNVLNMMLDPIFMFGYLGFPALGIQGAAVASITALGLTLIAGLVIFYTGRANVRLHLIGEESISWSSMWKIVKIGVPAWINSLSVSASQFVLAPMIAVFGTAVVAAYGIGMQVLGFGLMIVVGIGLGLSSLIGHNVGGGKVVRARKTADQAIVLSLSLMALFGAAIFLLANPIARLFFDDPGTVDHTVTLLRIIAFAFPGYGVFFMVDGIHVGVGLNTPMMVFSMIRAWLFLVIPAYLVVHAFEYNQVSVWWVVVASSLAAAVMVYVYYRRGRWLTIQV
jgi:putative MATE family efflux protein